MYHEMGINVNAMWQRCVGVDSVMSWLAGWLAGWLTENV